jgi:hypothetical protein
MSIKSFVVSLFSIGLVIFFVSAGNSFGAAVNRLKVNNLKIDRTVAVVHSSLLELTASSSAPSSAYTYSEGAISRIGSSSITLSNGATYLMDNNTVCSTPGNMGTVSGGGNMMNIPCSELTFNQTVTITAVQNASGQLVAVKIAIFPS